MNLVATEMTAGIRRGRGRRTVATAVTMTDMTGIEKAGRGCKSLIATCLVENLPKTTAEKSVTEAVTKTGSGAMLVVRGVAAVAGTGIVVGRNSNDTGGWDEQGGTASSLSAGSFPVHPERICSSSSREKESELCTTWE